MASREELPPITNTNPARPQRQPPPEPETVTAEIAHPVDDPLDSRILASLVEMRRTEVDPMNEWVPDGTRMLPWIQSTIALEAALRKVKQQVVLRDALLGIRPLNPALLDAHFADRYGRPRHK